MRVLDLTCVLAGPCATKVLADHGADVIKVESVRRSDPTRFRARSCTRDVQGTQGGTARVGRGTRHLGPLRRATVTIRPAAAPCCRGRRAAAVGVFRGQAGGVARPGPAACGRGDARLPRGCGGAPAPSHPSGRTGPVRTWAGARRCRPRWS
ncbi:CoA transferase [Streptomyces sp. NPDC050546]|uniref:CoA transferase n=1 Tax=Streptomyces sp. NPDC050546 TaxID=3365628 RepID=UPI00379B2937